MTINELCYYQSSVRGQYIKKADIMRLLYNWAGGYDYIETDLRGALETVAKADTFYNVEDTWTGPTATSQNA